MSDRIILSGRVLIGAEVPVLMSVTDATEEIADANLLTSVTLTELNDRPNPDDMKGLIRKNGGKKSRAREWRVYRQLSYRIVAISFMEDSSSIQDQGRESSIEPDELNIVPLYSVTALYLRHLKSGERVMMHQNERSIMCVLNDMSRLDSGRTNYFDGAPYHFENATETTCDLVIDNNLMNNGPAIVFKDIDRATMDPIKIARSMNRYAKRFR